MVNERRDGTEDKLEFDGRFRTFVKWSFGVIPILFSICVFSLTLYVVIVEFERFTSIIFEQYAVMVVIPILGSAAFFMVVTLRVVAGPIEFEGLGFKFSGASGPIVLWVISFAFLVAAAKLLWKA